MSKKVREQKRIKTTRNIHEWWDPSFPNGMSFFKCEKCGALVSTQGNATEDYDNGCFFVVDFTKMPDFSRKAKPIIVDGIKFPSINKAAEVMDVYQGSLRDALVEKRKFKGHTVEFDEDPYAQEREICTGGYGGYGFVPVHYCPNCGRKVVNDKLEVK